ncbi:MAG: Cu(I)-responsive transcriptional regulator [Cognatishimia sp.]|uniref:Cu(I)-responsive transcriptional regulator n=1 Tax=Cognatishimia sp. TaxID=2211648 RepID=UPI00405836C0
MNISQVSRAAKLPVKTIRYYEDIGFISPDRDTNGYRNFSENDLHKLAFVGRARSLGFKIEDCRALLALYEDQGRASADVKQLAQSHLTQIDEKIAGLKSMRDTLATLITSCAGDARPDCPILNDLGKMAGTAKT